MDDDKASLRLMEVVKPGKGGWYTYIFRFDFKVTDDTGDCFTIGSSAIGFDKTDTPQIVAKKLQELARQVGSYTSNKEAKHGSKKEGK